jgi:outer membrane lipoprotein-sorting protein
MRRVPRSMLTAVLAVAGSITLAAQAQTAQPPAAPAATVDEIVAKNLKAKGGAEKWKSIQTMKMSGKVTAQGLELPMTVMAKRPNLMRQEMTLQDKKIIQSFDGTTVWMINPMMGSDTPQEMTGPQAEMAKSQADFDGDLVDYKSKGTAVDLVGQETIDGTKVYHLKVTRKNGTTRELFLDVDSGIDLRTISTIEREGQQATITSDLSNYQSVEGIMVPFSVKQSLNGTPIAQMTIDKVEFNVPIENSLFKLKQ